MLGLAEGGMPPSSWYREGRRRHQPRTEDGDGRLVTVLRAAVTVWRSCGTLRYAAVRHCRGPVRAGVVGAPGHETARGCYAG
jgi:hypothetical protein